jgi:hypothetical protein
VRIGEIEFHKGDILIYAHDEDQRRNPPFQGRW